MRLRNRLSYANVMATVAVVIAMTGSAYVAWALEKNEVKSFHIDNGTIKTEDLDKNATIGNARKVNGSRIRQIHWKAPASPTPPPVNWERLFKINGLTISAWCSGRRRSRLPASADECQQEHPRDRPRTCKDLRGRGALRRDVSRRSQ